MKYGKVRQRISCSRKSGKLPMTGDKLLFILSHLKNNPLQEYHGAGFGMTQLQCNNRVHLLRRFYSGTLKNIGELPPDRNSLRMPYLLQSCENMLLDSTERPIQRPQADDTTSKSPVTAVKTRSVKNNLLCNTQKRILWLSGTFDGNVHDRKIADEQDRAFPCRHHPMARHRILRDVLNLGSMIR
jgi:hypothetical protein